jgi:hypothetical protein
MSRVFGPCVCGWCQEELQKPGHSTNTRPLICNGDMFVKIAGRCSRCHFPLSDDVYMVREKINWRTLGPPDGAVAFWQYEVVPVCEVCVTEVELDRARRGYQRPCMGGCGKQLHFAVNVRHSRKACSTACYRRGWRKQHRFKSTRCANCDIVFSTTRLDARFCSSACRQSAYRVRVRSGLAEAASALEATEAP